MILKFYPNQPDGQKSLNSSPKNNFLCQTVTFNPVQLVPSRVTLPLPIIVGPALGSVVTDDLTVDDPLPEVQLVTLVANLLIPDCLPMSRCPSCSPIYLPSYTSTSHMPPLWLDCAMSASLASQVALGY